MASTGGKATKGILTRKKRLACRRNFKKARQVRQLNRIRQGAETAFAALQPYREQEREWIEAQVAESRAELAILEPLIRQDPQLNQILERLKSWQAQAEAADRHQKDSH